MGNVCEFLNILSIYEMLGFLNVGKFTRASSDVYFSHLKMLIFT